MENFITKYERTLAGYIENFLNTTKVKIWADAFNTDSSPHSQSTLFLGHLETERTTIVRDDKRIYLKTSTIEVRAEVYSQKNHASALALIEYVFDDVLEGYKPYLEFSPFEADKTGNVQRNKDKSCWVYSGTGYTSIRSDVTELTLCQDLPPIPRIVQVGLSNNLLETDYAKFNRTEG